MKQKTSVASCADIMSRVTRWKWKSHRRSRSAFDDEAHPIKLNQANIIDSTSTRSNLRVEGRKRNRITTANAMGQIASVSCSSLRKISVASCADIMSRVTRWKGKSNRRSRSADDDEADPIKLDQASIIGSTSIISYGGRPHQE